MKKNSLNRPLPGRPAIAGILAAAALAALPGSASAAGSIAMNFAENAANQVFAGGADIGPALSDGATKVNSSFWNSSIDRDSGTLAAGEIGSVNTLIDSTGTATTASVTWSSKNTWYNGDGTGSDEAKLAVGYLDDGGAGASFTVSNIPYSKYNVYVLFTSDQNGDYTHGTLTIGGTAYLGGPFPAHGRVTDGTGWVLADGTVHGNYALVTDLTSSTLTVSATRDAGRSPITGFIIEDISDKVYDSFTLPGEINFDHAVLGDGLTSTFRPGTDKVTGTVTDGFAVGTAPGETHTIRLVLPADLATGTYTLIDYDGAIGGAGFAGLQLDPIPGVTAALVDNAADTSVDVEITAIDPLVWDGATSNEWDETTANFTLGGVPTAFASGARVLFDATATTTGAIDITVPVEPSLATFDFDDPTAYTLSGEALTGVALLVKKGSGTLTLLNDCDFTGETTVENGTLAVGDGTTGVLAPHSNVSIEAPATLIVNAPAGSTIDPPIVNDGVVEVTGPNDVEMKSVVTGTGEMVKTGAGTLTISGAPSDIEGTLTIHEGTVVLATSNYQRALGNSAGIVVEDGATLRIDSINVLIVDHGTENTPVTVNAGGTVELNAFHNHFGLLTLNGGTVTGISSAGWSDQYSTFDDVVTVAGTQQSIITDTSGLSYAFYNPAVEFNVADTGDASGVDLDFQSPIVGPGGLRKTGPGTMALRAENTYTGDTIVEEGTLLVATASLADAADVKLTTGATLDLQFGGTDVIDQLRIDGAAQDPGTWGAIGSGADHETALITGTGMLDVTTGPEGYEAWAAGFAGLTDPSPDLDFEGDGLESCSEWVLGGDPTANDAAGIAPTFDNATDPDNFLFVFRRTLDSLNDPNTTIAVEYGSDLVGWTTAEDGVDGVVITEDIDFFGTDIDRVTVAIPRALAADGKLFVRLKVEVTTP